MVQITVNGESRSFDGDPEMPLLWYLRDELGLTGTKFGCGMALCGACTVHVDGVAVRPGVTPVGSVDGKVTTIETVDAERIGKAVLDTRGIWPDQPVGAPMEQPLRMAG